MIGYGELSAAKQPRLQINGKNIIWAGAAIAAAVCSYILLVRNMQFSLTPHVAFFEYVCGMQFQFAEGIGYVSAADGLAITDGCIGAKLFVSMFLIVTLGFAPRATCQTTAGLSPAKLAPYCVAKVCRIYGYACTSAPCLEPILRRPGSSCYLANCSKRKPLRSSVLFFVKAYGICAGCALMISIFRIAISIPTLALANAQLIHNIISIIIYFASLIGTFAVMQGRARKQTREVADEAD